MDEAEEGVKKEGAEPDGPSLEPLREGLSVVGIGASAGGLNALKLLFEQVPADSGLAWVVVVHLSPEHESHLAQILQTHSEMPVEQVSETSPLEPNHVYVIPPGSNLDAIDTHLRLSALEDQRRERAPIDHFFRTLASTHDGHSIGVILTGSGSDGTLGIKEMKESGALTVVQDPAEAEFNGMPLSAIATGLVDLVLPLDEIADAIMRFVKTQPRLPTDDDLEQDDWRLLQKVFAQVRARTGRDFSRYKRSTIMRRIQRRMQLRHVEQLSEYVALMREEPAEVYDLADDFLITVTNFFRDSAVWSLLKHDVIPKLFDEKGPDDELRVWTVGCATGEEAYSLAILLLEEASRRKLRLPKIQVFASDLHEQSLARAREGFYPGEIERDVSEDRLRRYFRREQGGYRISKDVRQLVLFAPHNLLSDPPFSKVDLITCRNLLIYLQRDVQAEVIDLFHYALQPEGFLLLGTSETVETSDLFRQQSKPHALYQKRNVPAPEPRLPAFPLTPAKRIRGGGDALDLDEPRHYGGLHQLMLDHFGPPSMLISPDQKVVHLSARAGRYLVHPGGALTASALKLVREELRIELRSALRDANDMQTIVRTEPVEVDIDGSSIYVALQVRPAIGPNHEGFALVIFDEVPRPKSDDEGTEAAHSGGPKPGRVRELEAELDLTKQRLQIIIEEYESSQEQMKASNEELQSAVEELRSTMEELETSKEEMQSMNEELQAVNEENRHKVEELDQLSNDLQNLLIATDIATLFLDRQLQIHRFTPKISELFNIRMTDRGRPITDLTKRFGYDELVADARSVLRKLTPIQRELQDRQQRWYLTRVLPYRSDDRIGGVVITFVDITERKAVETELREREQQLANELRALERLHELVARLLRHDDEASALDEALAAAVGLTGSKMGTVHLLDDRKQKLELSAQHGFGDDVVEKWRSLDVDGDNPEARALKSEDRIIVEDIDSGGAYLRYRAAAIDLGFRAMQATPLISRNGEKLGVLTTHYPVPHRPSDYNLRMLDLYARQASDFLEHFRRMGSRASEPETVAE